MTQAVETLDELPFFFDGSERSLFGVLHRPAPRPEGRPAFVFCHALAEEKLWSHRVFVSYARELAADGYPVLRFDLTGNGDSDGAFSEVSMATFAADVGCAVQEVRRRTGAGAVSLLGLRLGANVAMMAADAAADIRHLILWAPITNGERYAQDLLRINLMTQMASYKAVRHERPELVGQMQQGGTVNIDGYEMAWPLYSSIASLTPAPRARSFGGSCLVVQIERQRRPSAELDALSASYPASTLAHAQEDAFWKEIQAFYQRAPNLFAVTTEWLATHR